MENNEIKHIVDVLIKKHFDRSQDALAKRMGVKQQAVSAWLNGGGMGPSNQKKLRELWAEYQREGVMQIDQVMTKEEARSLVDDILDSQSLIFKTALTVSARAYHKAVEGEREMSAMNDRMARMEDKIGMLTDQIANLVGAILGNGGPAKRETPLLGGA